MISDQTQPMPLRSSAPTGAHLAIALQNDPMMHQVKILIPRKLTVAVNWVALDRIARDTTR